jgi:Undecaprenyl-phosphate galactose phosphotransferase WbaP
VLWGWARDSGPRVGEPAGTAGRGAEELWREGDRLTMEPAAAVRVASLVEERAGERSRVGIPRWARPARLLVLAATDAVVLTVLTLGVVVLWAVTVRGQPLALYLQALPLIGLLPLNFALGGLYPGFGLAAVETLRRLSLRTSFVFVVLAAATFALRVPPHFSRFVFVAVWVGSLILLPLARFAVLTVVGKTRWWGEPAVVIGHGWLAHRLIRSLSAARSFGYRPRWVLSTCEAGAPSTFEGLPVVGGLAVAEELAAQGVRVALVAVEDGEASTDLVHELQRSFRHVLSIRGGPEMPVEGVEVRNLGGVLGVEFSNQLLRRRNRLLKRAMDVSVAGAGLLLASPLITAAGLLVKLVSPGPLLFGQEREGQDGHRFRVWKLRTMHVDAEARLERYLASNLEAQQEWQRCFKLARDPRVIPYLGRWLRRFSVDELPQLWNVVKGEMSLVGPRPFPEYHLLSFSPQFRRLRCRVRPGLTGLWQVSVRSLGGIEEQELCDAYYIRNWSVWMDLYILGKTAVAVVAGRGAY